MSWVLNRIPGAPRLRRERERKEGRREGERERGRVEGRRKMH
jgi:hypothetical protein